MNAGETPSERHAQHVQARQAVRWVLIAGVVIAIVVVLWNQGQRLIAGETSGAVAYLLTALLVFGDAVCPVLPGETTLSAASVLASSGKLSIWLVILAGAIGAITGDSAVYWAARKAKGRIRHWMDRAADTKSAGKVLEMLSKRGPVFLLFGRYVPGVRFVLNAALGGVVHMPYGHFLMWSALSGTMWSAFTCASAYAISNALAGYPLLSLIATLSISTVLIGTVIWVQKKLGGHARHAPAPAQEH